MKKLEKMVIALLLIVALGCVKSIPAKADTVQVTTFSGAVVISNGSTVFNDCSFTGNEGNSLGGAVAVLSASSTVSFQNCVMTGNTADHGGAAASSGVIMVEGCKIYNNDARIMGNDLYIDEFGRLTINNSLDELKALYEADSVTLTGIFDDADTSVELGGTITGEKGLTFQLSTEEPTPTPTLGESGSSGSGESGSNHPQTTYSNTYSPTINNVVQAPKESTADPTASPTPKTTKTGDSVEASATVSDVKEARTYTTKTDEAGNSSLEITEGQNTITININVGTGEGVEAAPNGTPETSSQGTVISEPDLAVSADPETVYIQKRSNWLDVVQMVLLGLIVLYLIKGDKIKGIFQRKSN